MASAKPQRGKLEVTEGKLKGQSVAFMFNPNQYSISKDNGWTASPKKGSNVPKYDFAGGGPREVQLELFFDSYLPRAEVVAQDLRYLTNKLFNFMMIDKGPLKGKNSHMGHPPKCQLIWGNDTPNHFDCYIKSCHVKFTLFNNDGLPVRATAALNLIEARDSEDMLPTNPTSLGEPGRRLVTLREGDRLDLIAFQEYGEATAWRDIAEANHIVNPLALQPGMVLVIPPR